MRPADGYTLLWATGANATANTFNDKLNFNFIRDIAPVAGTFRTIFVVVVMRFRSLFAIVPAVCTTLIRNPVCRLAESDRDSD